MARPKKTLTPDESAAILAAYKHNQENSAQISVTETKALSDRIQYIADDPAKPAKVPVVRFQMGLPCDLLGSKVSFASSRSTSLEATPLGIIMRSKDSKRKMLVTWANVKAAEFAWDGE